MRKLGILGALAAVAVLAACGSSSSDKKTAGFPQPSGTVAVNFSVNDTANQVWKAGELEWKGEVNYNATTRTATRDATWLGATWALLYDDGPWDQDPPGHEPSGSTAGDHIWGVTVFVTPPASGSETFQYGLRDATNPDRANGGWLWVGPNGSFTVNAGQATAVNAPGITFPAHGTVDMRLTIDTAALLAGFNPPTTSLTVKGSAWGWSEYTLSDDGTKGDATAGDGIYTFDLSQNINQAAPPYPGLLKSGDRPEWVYVIDGVEYKDGTGAAAADGITAYTGASGTWTQRTIVFTDPPFVNTAINVP
jgi:hypothetical protein